MGDHSYFFNFEKMAYVKGKHPSGCILCLARDNNPDVVDLSIWRDELFIVSVNLYPYNPGHLLAVSPASRGGRAGAHRGGGDAGLPRCNAGSCWIS